MKRIVLLPILAAGLGVFLLLVILSGPVSAEPDIVLVDRAGGVDDPGCGDGIFPPCYSIQYAVHSVASSGDTVLVAAGVYTETFNMQPCVDVVSESGPAVTIIDGEYSRGPMVTASGAAISPTVKLEGFTITGGYTTWLGGAVFVNDGASMTISDTHIISNVAGVEGGGISLMSSASLLLYGSTLEDHNKAALRMDDASVTILHSEFLTNTRPATDDGSWGGGLLAQNGCTLVISDTLFQGNLAHHGGGILFADSDLTLFNSEFYSNTAGGGGGVMSLGSVIFEIRGNTFAYNEARSAGGVGIGGMESDHAEGVFAENVVRNNVNTTHGGAGLRIEYTTAVITGNQFISNTGLSHGGGGIRVDGDSIFEIEDNTIAYNVAPNGAGIAINGGSGDIISNSVFFNAVTAFGGAGIHLSNATAVISGNHIMGNTSHSHSGGGIRVEGESSFDIRHNLIDLNTAVSGGGIGVSGGTGNVVDNAFLGNQATSFGGGGILVGTTVITITGNEIFSNISSSKAGGGIRVEGEPTFEIRNNIIEFNEATSWGGIGIAGGTGSIEDNVIRNNQAYSGGEGGGIGLSSSSPVVVSTNWVSENSRGGISVSDANATIVNNIIAHNTGGGSKAQVSIHGSTPVTLTNNTIVGNGVDNGIDIKDYSAPNITNNIIAGNAYGIRSWGDVLPTLIHNDLWENSSGNYEEVDPGEDDIACDPDFEDEFNDDFHLGICSCVVDKGTNVGASAVDYDGNARPVDGDGTGGAIVDIGAYERLTVTAPLPVAGFTHVAVGLVVTFTNTSSDAVSYHWDFGDGAGSSTDVNPTYTYAMPSNYSVALTATCSFGCTNIYQDDVEVKQYYVFLPIIMLPSP